MTNDTNDKGDKHMASIIEEGYAPQHELDSWDFPLWSEILPGLWVGGTDDNDTIETSANTRLSREITKNDFDTVVTLYAWAKPADWLVDELRFGFYDSNIEHIDWEKLSRVVEYAHTAWKSGNKTLIRCQAGLNRSGLTTALVLMREGYEAADAISLMRSKRTNYVLCNADFEKHLLQLGAPDAE
jgi:protein-tyrosine phosphatase